NGLSGTGTTSGANSAASNGTAVQTVSGNDSVTTAPSSAAGNGSTAKSGTAAGASSANQTSAVSGAVTKSEYSQLAQTGIGISVACAIILALSGLAYAVKMFVQYKRETAE
ncbi:MAG: conjugal transfer protein, partial [Bifidobacterium dentium]